MILDENTPSLIWSTNHDPAYFILKEFNEEIGIKEHRDSWSNILDYVKSFLSNEDWYYEKSVIWAVSKKFTIQISLPFGDILKAREPVWMNALLKGIGLDKIRLSEEEITKLGSLDKFRRLIYIEHLKNTKKRKIKKIKS